MMIIKPEGSRKSCPAGGRTPRGRVATRVLNTNRPDGFDLYNNNNNNVRSNRGESQNVTSWTINNNVVKCIHWPQTVAVPGAYCYLFGCLKKPMNCTLIYYSCIHAHTRVCTHASKPFCLTLTMLRHIISNNPAGKKKVAFCRRARTVINAYSVHTARVA